MYLCGLDRFVLVDLGCRTICSYLCANGVLVGMHWWRRVTACVKFSPRETALRCAQLVGYQAHFWYLPESTVAVCRWRVDPTLSLRKRFPAWVRRLLRSPYSSSAIGWMDSAAAASMNVCGLWPIGQGLLGLGPLQACVFAGGVDAHRERFSVDRDDLDLTRTPSPSMTFFS